MRFDVANWKEFRLGDLFDRLESGLVNNTSKLDEGDEIPYIGAKRDDNGVMFHCTYNSAFVQSGNCVLFICDGQGSVGYANYMDSAFIATVNVVAGYLDVMTPAIGLFLATVISLERPKYSYGRKWKTHLRDTEVKLPVQHNADGTPAVDLTKKWSDDGYIPDWQFMENYIKSLHYKPLTTKNKSGQAPELSVQNWKEFVFTDIFKLRGGFYNKKPEHSIDGAIPFLASTESHNGVTEYYSIDDIEQWDKVGNEDYSLDKKMFDGNCIAVTVNGSVCNAFYQSERFTCSHDITVLYLKKHTLNQYIGLFLCTMIMRDKYRWSYGRKPHDVKKFGKSIIKLPVTSDGHPDWLFMENYIKSLPYGDRLEG